MARWRLTASHYLHTVPPTEWEYKETDRNTGRQNRMVSKVPMLLDIKDPAGFNYPELGDIIVTDGHNPERRDIQFEGPPTIDMEPIDDEARKITQSYIDSGAWRKPTDNEPHGEGLIKRFMEEIAKAQSTGPISASAVGAKEFADLQEQVKALMDQNAKLQEVASAVNDPPSSRRGL